MELFSIRIRRTFQLVSTVFTDETADACDARIVFYLDKRAFFGLGLLPEKIFFRYDEVIRNQ